MFVVVQCVAHTSAIAVEPPFTAASADASGACSAIARWPERSASARRRDLAGPFFWQRNAALLLPVRWLDFRKRLQSKPRVLLKGHLVMFVETFTNPAGSQWRGASTSISRSHFATETDSVANREEADETRGTRHLVARACGAASKEVDSPESASLRLVPRKLDGDGSRVARVPHSMPPIPTQGEQQAHLHRIFRSCLRNLCEQTVLGFGRTVSNRDEGKRGRRRKLLTPETFSLDALGCTADARVFRGGNQFYLPHLTPQHVCDVLPGAPASAHGDFIVVRGDVVSPRSRCVLFAATNPRGVPGRRLGRAGRGGSCPRNDD